MSYYNLDTKWWPFRDRNGGVILKSKTPTRDVYEAIADPTRRELLHLLAVSGELPLHALTVQFPMGRTAVSKHLSVLKEADLVIERRAGRETRYRLNPDPLKQVQDWVAFYSKFWSANLLRLNQLLEEEEE